MEVVCPVGMFVYIAVCMLAADGAVFDTPEKKSMVLGTPKPKHPNHKKEKGGGQNKVNLAGMWPKQGEWQKRVPNEYNGGRIEPHDWSK